jgi:TatD DNase family protein
MFDAHAHLQDPRLAGRLDGVAAAAAAAGVTGLCCCGTSPDDWEATARLAAARFPFIIVPAFGVHPWYAAGLPPDWLDRLRARLEANPVAALGEIGLDGIRTDVPPAAQESVLKAQLEEAARRRTPVILHGARAWGRLADAVQPYADRLPAIIAHGFGGSAEIMRRFLEMGAFLSFAGNVCNPAAKKVRSAVAQVPEDRLLIETDSPDLFPPGGDSAGTGPDGRPVNQPCNLRLTLAAAALLRRTSPEALSDATGSNARRALLS